MIEQPSKTKIMVPNLLLSNPENRTPYFLTGRGGHPPDGSEECGLAQFVQGLESNHYRVDTLRPAVEAVIAADAAALMAAARARAQSK